MMPPVDEMYLASLINKGRQAYEKGLTDPTALPVETILQMATINGAESVLWNNEIGSLEVGKKVSFWNLNSAYKRFFQFVIRPQKTSWMLITKCYILLPFLYFL